MIRQCAFRNQIRAYWYPEFQRPQVHGCEIDSARILPVRSGRPPGTKLSEAADVLVIATIDWDLELRKVPPSG